MACSSLTEVIFNMPSSGKALHPYSSVPVLILKFSFAAMKVISQILFRVLFFLANLPSESTTKQLLFQWLEF